MKIGLAGYGKMGKMVEVAALARGHEVVSITDPAFPPGALSVPSRPELADVIIEFTVPGTALDNIRAAAALGKPVVTGTTGWYGALPEAAAAVEQAGTALLWSSNFSLGVNLFYRVASYAAALIDPFEEYDVGGCEVHHNKKADSPSGTARTLVERVLSVMKRKTRVVWDSPREAAPAGTIHYASLRVGAVPGLHTLCFDSPADSIEITHRARSREGFASGAVLAAEWLVRSGPGRKAAAGEAGGKRRGVFTMDDVLKDILP
jgi:4-hydroxy-tetrahydrodipicolinate reductase